MSGPYSVIYQDPPWKYGSGGARGGRFGDLDYPTMTPEEIAALPVSELAAKNCALFMWVTGSFVAEAMAIAAVWGFAFVRVDKVWAKKKSKGGRHGVVGPWGMSDAEFLLLFVRGSMCSGQAARNQWTVYEAEYPGRHSEKPAIFRELIEARFPAARRLEMFARVAAPGWDVWGNEVEGSIVLPARSVAGQSDLFKQGGALCVE